MARKVKDCNVNNSVFSENRINIKEEYEDVDYLGSDHEVLISETTSNIKNIEIDYADDVKLKQYGVSTVYNIKIEPNVDNDSTKAQSPDNTIMIKEEYKLHNNLNNMHDNLTYIDEKGIEDCKLKLTSYLNDGKIDYHEYNNVVHNKVEVEDEIVAKTKVEIINKELFCEQCHENYEDYCSNCKMLVHILDKNVLSTVDNKEQIPKDILEIRELSTHIGVFSIKVIPEGVRFGPISNLNSSEYSWKIKKGKLAVGEDKTECLNWMQYITSTRSVSEHNLVPFLYEDKLYYRCIHKIQVGEELLVYFGEQYEDCFTDDVEITYIPPTVMEVRNAFACTFCCLGFDSKEHLAKHKSICFSGVNGEFSVEDITQCSFCKIYLEKKEYLEYHMDYCCEKSARQVTLPASKTQMVLAGKRVKLGTNDEARQFFCSECNFKTIYRRCLIEHIYAKHLKTKRFKCAKCEYRTDYKGNLRSHFSIHEEVKRFNCSDCDFKTNHKHSLQLHTTAKHLKTKRFKCTKCEYKTDYKGNLRNHLSIHLEVKQFSCSDCDFKTNHKHSLQLHTNGKHLKIKRFKCTECEYRTDYKGNLRIHLGTHEEVKRFSCGQCHFKTHNIDYLKVHINGKHLHPKRFKCTKCEHETCYKGHFRRHLLVHDKTVLFNTSESKPKIKEKNCSKVDRNINNLQVFNCSKCEYQANNKRSLIVHLNKHEGIKRFDCPQCDFKTDHKSCLNDHIAGKHLNEKRFKCTFCEYKSAHRANLRRHILIHDVEGRFQCDECDYRTNFGKSLKMHIFARHLQENKTKQKRDTRI